MDREGRRSRRHSGCVRKRGTGAHGAAARLSRVPSGSRRLRDPGTGTQTRSEDGGRFRRPGGLFQGRIIAEKYIEHNTNTADAARKRKPRLFSYCSVSPFSFPIDRSRIVWYNGFAVRQKLTQSYVFVEKRSRKRRKTDNGKSRIHRH